MAVNKGNQVLVIPGLILDDGHGHRVTFAVDSLTGSHTLHLPDADGTVATGAGGLPETGGTMTGTLVMGEAVELEFGEPDTTLRQDTTHFGTGTLVFDGSSGASVTRYIACSGPLEIDANTGISGTGAYDSNLILGQLGATTLAGTTRGVTSLGSHTVTLIGDNGIGIATDGNTAHMAALKNTNLTASRTIQFPDAAGTITVVTAAPATATSAGVVGQIAYDASYFYICTATNTWKRAGIAAW